MALSGRRGFSQSSRGAGVFARQLAYVLILAVALALSAAAALSAAQETPKSTAAAGFDAKNHVTIVKIEPDPGAEEVRVFFSQPLGLESLQGNLRLLPRIKIDWNRTTLDPKGVLTLRGAFRYGAGYLINLPETLRWGKRPTIKRSTPFSWPTGLPRWNSWGPKASSSAIASSCCTSGPRMSTT